MATTSKTKTTKAATKPPKAAKPAAPRKKKGISEPGSRGLSAAELVFGQPPADMTALRDAVAADGGVPLGAYRDPLGGHWQLLAGLPLDRVSPTPFQRDLSETHAARLAEVIQRMDRFLDPLIVVRTAQGSYWSPNGYHRLSAMQRLGARSVVAIVIPDEKLAYQILALNTEKAHNLKERSLEVIRMARLLAAANSHKETNFAAEFEEAAFLTLGLCYEQRPRFSGGAYQALLRRADAFLEESLAAALSRREKRAATLLEIDDVVSEIVKKLKEKGVDSPALRAFVVAQVNPLRGAERGATGVNFDEVTRTMLKAAKEFDLSSVGAEQLARAGGGPPAEE